ncbi:MAG: copper ion binding protein, partial [Deltaproteobacteria bacterium]|nr:copper ion binding protein [Deltaproteobacteria bacterium]
MAKDPVCGMEVEPKRAAGSSSYKGEAVYFCNPNCKKRFDADPSAFLRSEEEQARREDNPVEDSVTSGLKKMEIPITGMSCASCAAKIEKGLGVLAGVDKASVNFATEKVSISYDPASVGPADLIEAVRRLGYGTGTATATIPIQGMNCASCVAKIEDALGAL